MTETYNDLRKRLDQGETTCSHIVAGALERAGATKDLNAFLALFNERAAARAEEIDRRVQSGTAGRLAGMTIALKDNIAVRDEQLTCGSRILTGFTSLYSATAVARLEAADAIVIGKTNMDEFAMGSSNESSYFGPAHHPMDRERVPGGSSGGSGIAVATAVTQASLGSETGGSVRQPAAFLGIVGVKPTYGRVSRYGLVAFASSLDQISPFARCVADAALVLETIAGSDPNDATSSTRPVQNYADGLDTADVHGKRIGIPSEYNIDGMHDSVVGALNEMRRRLVEAGAEVVEISLPHTKYTIPCYYVIATAEASSNLARFDGARYGYRSPNATTVEEMYEMSRSEGFGEEVKRRIMLGTFVLSSGYYDAYYRKAQQVRRLIHDDMTSAFANVDLILAPTTPTPAFKLGEKAGDPIAMYLSDIFTAATNLAGVPAISFPAGCDATTGLPIGLQFIAPHFGEAEMFAAAAWAERTLKA
ncbi:MAG: Asp-tRNA(Asn)/Glu-tRNA(Gln) amidotransferase subunit GatA [Bacteroidetes bacterium]|nr:Asp-tRNA(Asn)/Glu-tRNA(Gln) amidotransferase subunit GatA [Bacteroidota bacterium]